MSSWTWNHNTQGLNKCHNNMMHNIPILFNISPSILLSSCLLILKWHLQSLKHLCKLHFVFISTDPWVRWAIVTTERLSSVVHRPLTFHILINSSEATGPIWTKLWWNGPWMAPFQNCVRWSRLPTKMAAKLKIEKRGMKF